MLLYKRAIIFLLALCVTFAHLPDGLAAPLDTRAGTQMDAAQMEVAPMHAPCHELESVHIAHEPSAPCAENFQNMPSHDCCVSFAAIVPSASPVIEPIAGHEAIAFAPSPPLAARPADIERPPWRA